LFRKTTVSQQRLPHVSATDQDHRPSLVGAKDLLDLGDQFFTTVADSRVAKLAKVSEILSHLRRRET